MVEGDSLPVNGEKEAVTYKQDGEKRGTSSLLINSQTASTGIPNPNGHGRPLTSEYSVQLGFSFNKALGSNLEILRTAVVKQDFDLAVIVDGKEGAGKSVLGMQIAHFLDVERHIDLETQICFTPAQFKRAVNTLGKGKAIVWDEARAGLNRRRSTQEINLDMTDMLAECRQNNLFMVIIMPSFFDMDRNVAVHRSRILINARYDFKGPKDAPLRRGFFRLYSESGKHKLFENRELRYTYPYLHNECFDGVFSHHYVVDEQEYRRKKKEAVLRYTRNNSGEIPNRDLGRALVFLRKHKLLIRGCVPKIAEIMGVDRRTVYNWMDEFKEVEVNEDGI